MKKKINQIKLEFLNADYKKILTLSKYYSNDDRIGVKKIIEKYRRKLKYIDTENKRIQKIKKYETEYYKKGYKYVAGIDEVGVGPLAGPVIASAVILPEDITINKINDSKKLSSNIRKKILVEIKKKAIDIGIGIVDEKIVDEINILNARKLAMKKAIKDLNIIPDILLIDAIILDNVFIEQKCIIKGDEKSISIAAASIVAKEIRDDLMVDYSKKYCEYGFEFNKGYGTKYHIDCIRKYGLCALHRKSFTKNFIGENNER